MNIDEIYSLLGAITNISYVPIFLVLMFSGSYKRYWGFTSYIFLFAVWGYADYLMGLTDEYLPIWRQYNFCAVLLPFCFFLFSQEFTQKKSRFSYIFFGFLCVFFLFLNYYRNILIPDSIIEHTGLELVKHVLIYDFFAIYSCSLVLFGTLWMIKFYKATKTLYFWMIFGCCLTTIGEFYSYGTVYFESLYNYPYISYFVCFLPYFVTYLVLRYRLFDARSVLLQMFRWVFIIGVGSLSAGIMYWILMEYLSYTISYNIPLIIITATLFGVIDILARSHMVRSWFRLSDLVHLENSVKEFLASTSVYESHDELTKNILSTLQSGLKISTVQLLPVDQMKQFPKILSELAYAPKTIKIISYKEAKTLESRDNHRAPYIEELEQIGELCIAIYVEKKLAFVLVLPEKDSQSPYTNNEKSIIATMRPKIALSLQILEYNKSLRAEVERQTEQINEQKKEIELSYQKLEALDKEKDVFMNMAAHELRTPMTIMRGYADIMLDGSSGGLNPMQKKLTENILKGSESLIALVNDLLNLSRIDAGKMELVYAPCDIKAVTQEVFGNFQSLMHQKEMQFFMEETTDPKKTLVTDQTKLVLIFNNLLSNAYKYTPEKGKVLWSVSTVTEYGKDWLEFSVKDSGVGIPEEELPTVFNRFASISTHNKITSTIQSTGLGLSIVKKIATGMQGTISVSSVVDEGTTFTVRLPYSPEKQ